MFKKRHLLSSTKFDFEEKAVLLRIDSDVDLKQEKNALIVDEAFRLSVTLPTIRLLLDKGANKIILLGHLGRPDGKFIPKLSLAPVSRWLVDHLQMPVEFISFNQIDQLDHLSSLVKKTTSSIILLENLRFWPEEEDNDVAFVKNIAGLGDCFVNDAFGVSHRRHASIVRFPELLPSFAGLRLEAEVQILTHLKANAKRPLVVVLGGSKKGKLDYLPFLADWSDTLLVGGKMPLLIKDQAASIDSDAIILADLIENTRDISQESIRRFKKVIEKAASIFVAGPMGVYEQKATASGTMEIIRSIASSSAFKLAAGGDTHRVLSWSDTWDDFDFVSVGGGAMLQFLKEDNLPGINALL